MRHIGETHQGCGRYKNRQAKFIPDCVTAKQNEMTMKGMKQNRLPILIDVAAGATSASDSAAA